MVLTVLVIPVILAVCALTVDVANARQRRNLAQGTADAAALAAAQDLPTLNSVVTTAKSYVSSNMAIPDSAWVGCRDTKKLSNTIDLADNDNECISVSTDLRQVRVKIPVIQERTYFGGIIGRGSIDVTAGAVASANMLRVDRIVPAAVTNLTGKGRVCIEQSGSNTTCSYSVRGQFGSLYSPRMRMYFPASNLIPNTLAVNYVLGIDHPLVKYKTGDTRTCDGSLLTPCAATNVATPAEANHIISMTGNNVPPVTEGFITGLTVATTDRGTVAFCGRLTRPDVDATNLNQPAPGNCTSAGQPQINLLGKTINGRHVYYWLTPAARSLFYPEVVALGWSDTDSRLAIGNPTYNTGDARLSCFLAGYVYNTVTGVETLPTCPNLTYPNTQTSAWNATVTDPLSKRTYSDSTGTTAWASDWSEVYDDASATSGGFFGSNGCCQVMYVRKSLRNDAIVRTARLANPNGSEAATAATLTIDVNGNNAGSGGLALDVSTNGSSWTQVGSYTRSNTPGWATYSYNLAPYISPTTQIRFRVSKEAGNNDYFLLANAQIAFSGTLTVPTTARIGPIFKTGFMADPRWGTIPQVASFTSTQGMPLTGFLGIYFYGSYTSSQKLLAVDAWVFDLSLMPVDPSVTGFSYGFDPKPTAQLTG